MLREERNVNKHDCDVTRREHKKLLKEHRQNQDQLKQVNADRHNQLSLLETTRENLLVSQSQLRRSRDKIEEM